MKSGQKKQKKNKQMKVGAKVFYSQKKKPRHKLKYAITNFFFFLKLNYIHITFFSPKQEQELKKMFWNRLKNNKTLRTSGWVAALKYTFDFLEVGEGMAHIILTLQNKKTESGKRG